MLQNIPKIFAVIGLLIVFSACNKENETPILTSNKPSYYKGDGVISKDIVGSPHISTNKGYTTEVSLNSNNFVSIFTDSVHITDLKIGQEYVSSSPTRFWSVLFYSQGDSMSYFVDDDNYGVDGVEYEFSFLGGKVE